MSRTRRLAAALACLLLAGCALPKAPAVAPKAAESPSTPSPAAVSRAAEVAKSPKANEPRRLTVTLSGDLLWHNTVWFSAADDHRRTGQGDEFDFAPMFEGMRGVIAEADLALCHEEVPFAPAGGPYRNYPLFAAPPQVAKAIAETGWDACTTLSNHALDQGFEGLARTLDVLDAAGVAHFGTYRDAGEAERTAIVTAPNGIRVAVVAGTYSLNGLKPPEGKEWAVDRLDPSRMLARAKAARAAGADIVLAYIHGGDEYVTAPNAQQRELAEVLTASPDVDLVYGSHVHVVQPWTQVNGKWVIYGLGNMIAQHTLENVRGAEGVTARLTFVEQEGRYEVAKAEYIPTLVTHYSQGPVRLLHVLAALAAGEGDQSRLRAAEVRIREAVLSLGATGLTEG